MRAQFAALFSFAAASCEARRARGWGELREPLRQSGSQRSRAPGTCAPRPLPLQPRLPRASCRRGEGGRTRGGPGGRHAVIGYRGARPLIPPRREGGAGRRLAPGLRAPVDPAAAVPPPPSPASGGAAARVPRGAGEEAGASSWQLQPPSPRSRGGKEGGARSCSRSGLLSGDRPLLRVLFLFSPQRRPPPPQPPAPSLRPGREGRGGGWALQKPASGRAPGELLPEPCARRRGGRPPARWWRRRRRPQKQQQQRRRRRRRRQEGARL